MVIDLVEIRIHREQDTTLSLELITGDAVREPQLPQNYPLHSKAQRNEAIAEVTMAIYNLLARL